ncbi:MAG: NTP transferase domain-containing protein [Spirochaetales bacterium]|jgi:CTP:phosphocholine cytidylyltransferase-like protein|nr:NTP transferase domain-containing protein [Spirochaetales bacterium]
MELSRVQFDVLVFLESQENQAFTQRSLAGGTGLSVGTINKTMGQLKDLALVKNNRLTPEGRQALEPYRVRRAVFLAAGFGSRMVPITLNTPKPLVRIKGVRIIDTLLDAVCAAGIEEIYLVRGYLGEQFDQLLYKYPRIQFLENPIYNESNNISSAFCARYYLKNAYVLESDLILYNPRLVAKYQFATNYLGAATERTDDWCFEVKNGCISRLKIGGKNCFQMFGISYWSAEDGAKMAEHILQVFESPGGRERYWDEVALGYFSKEYRVEVRECSFEDIAEVDTFRELKKLDPGYRG